MKTYGNIKVAIADDHEIFRDGLRAMLQKQQDILLVGEAANGKELIEQVISQEPDIVISDVKMPVMDGAAATRHLAEHYPHVGIIALTMFDEEDLIIDMLEAGARGYLSKAQAADLPEAIRTVASHATYAGSTSVAGAHRMSDPR